MPVKYIVGVADMKVASVAGDVIVTHALGSCLGVMVHDPVAVVGGMLHVMMPQASLNPEKAKTNPYMFVDSGVPAFFQELYAAGAHKQRCVVVVAGGSNVNGGDNDRFAIGKRNYLMLRKLFWKNGILIKAEDVGGTAPRTVYLEIGSGRTWMSTAGQERELQ
jgi:chemotaxis protein CheD